MSRNTFAIAALRRKRAHLAGEIALAERALTKLRRQLDTIDATINLFEPATNPELIPPVRPYTRGLLFAYGEVTRLIYQGLRQRDAPTRTQWLADYATAAKGLPEDRHIGAAVRKDVRKALVRLEARGQVRRVVREPEEWWELVG